MVEKMNGTEIETEISEGKENRIGNIDLPLAYICLKAGIIALRIGAEIYTLINNDDIVMLREDPFGSFIKAS